MARSQKDVTFDYALRLKDAGLVAADAAAQVGGAAKVIDLGAGRTDGRVKIELTAIEVADNDERFLIKTQFSNSATFASGVVGGPALDAGALEITKDSADTALGTYELPFSNQINGTVYRYFRLWTEVQGTVGTGINYSANAHLAQ